MFEFCIEKYAPENMYTYVDIWLFQIITHIF